MAFPWFAVASIAASLISKKSSSKSSDDSTSSSSSDGGSNFSTYLAYANGVKNLLSNNAKSQYDYQSKLLGLQNQYAQQNASIAYNRQRALTQDTPLLNMLGLRSAGINPATAGGTTANAASVNQANAGSTPSGPDVNGAENTKIAALQAIQQAETQQKQNQLIDANRENVEADTLNKKIEAQYAPERLSHTIDNLVASGHLTQANADRILYDLGFDKSTEQDRKDSIHYSALAQRKITELQDIQLKLDDEQRKQAEKITANLDKRLKLENDEISSRIKLNDASSTLAYANALKAKADAQLSTYEAQLKAAGIPYASDIAKAQRDLYYEQIDTEVYKQNDLYQSAGVKSLEAARNRNAMNHMTKHDWDSDAKMKGLGTAFGDLSPFKFSFGGK